MDVLQLQQPQNRDRAICARICCTGREVLVSDWWVLFVGCPSCCNSLRTEIEQLPRLFAAPAWKNSSLIGWYCFQDVLQLQQPQKAKANSLVALRANLLYRRDNTLI